METAGEKRFSALDRYLPLLFTFQSLGNLAVVADGSRKDNVVFV